MSSTLKYIKPPEAYCSAPNSLQKLYCQQSRMQLDDPQIGDGGPLSALQRETQAVPLHDEL